MSVGSLIGGAVVTGVVLYIFGFFFWTYGGKKLFWKWYFRKQIPKAREFLKLLNEIYNQNTTNKDIREKRESHLTKSGFNKHIIEYSTKLNQKEQINNGNPKRKQTIGKLKGFFKRRPKERAPTQDGTTGTETGTSGTNGGTSGNRNLETEQQRILPPSKSSIDDGTKQSVKWDWSSFSKNR